MKEVNSSCFHCRALETKSLSHCLESKTRPMGCGETEAAGHLVEESMADWIRN